jgi:hypothetical protein
MSLVGMDPREAERAELDAAYQAFLARGGKPEQIPRGAMAEAGWSAKQRANRQVVTKAKREATMAEHEARKRAQAGAVPPALPEHVNGYSLAKDKPPRVRQPVISKRERWPEFAPMLALALQHLVDGDTHHTLAAKLAKKPMAAWQLLIRLEGKGAVRRASWQGRTTWKRVP